MALPNGGKDGFFAYTYSTGAQSQRSRRAGRSAETPLYKAAESNDVNRIKQLLAEGADIDLAAGKDQETPLHRAITRGSTEAAKILIESGANINLPRSDGQTPLEMARERNRTKILLLLNNPPLQADKQ